MKGLSTEQLVAAVVDRGLLAGETVQGLRQEARRRRLDLMDLMTVRGRFPRSAIYCAAAEVRGMPFVDFQRVVPDLELAKSFPQSLIKRGTALPVLRSGACLTVACANPDDPFLLNEVSRRTGLELRQALAEPVALRNAASGVLARLVPGSAPLAETDPVAAFNGIVKEAYLRRASDIHLDPRVDGLHARIRVDGRLEALRLPLQPEQANALVSRVKVLAGLDIAEQRSAQDGGFTYEIPELPEVRMDLRTATLATRWGERVTLRLLAREGPEFSLVDTGMSPKALALFRRGLQQSHGMILLTGPTGSGKSTTLYAALREIRHPEVNIMTLEDPIESTIDGISQVQVGGADKITFAKGLRAMLRHDPDVLMVGEIRDHETAEVALRAAMTGHLLFSTLHTNDAVSAVTRLMDIGCEPYLIASTLVLVVAQRLVRRLCERCKQARVATKEERAFLGLNEEKVTLYGPNEKGCSHCNGTGFQGRIGVFEMLWLDKELQRLIADPCSHRQWMESIGARMTALQADGVSKVIAGQTTVEEVAGATLG